MAGPFIFISKHRIKEGKLEDYKLYVKKLVEMVEAKEPRLIAFEVYTSEEATEVFGIQVHPDADSMEFHMQALSVDNTIGGAFEFLEPTDSIEVCGTPSDRVLEMMRQLAGSGVALSVKPQHLGGFIHALGN